MFQYGQYLMKHSSAACLQWYSLQD